MLAHALVNSTSRSRVSRARPSSIAAAASARPAARSSARPAATSAAPAFSVTASRRGPRSPSSSARRSARWWPRRRPRGRSVARGREAERARVDRAHGHARRRDVGAHARAGRRQLVEPVDAVHDQRPLAAERAQRLGDRQRRAPRRTRRRAGDVRPTGFVSGPSTLKIVRTPSDAAHRAGVAHRRVMGRREEEAEADLVDALGDALGGRSTRTPSASSTSAEPRPSSTARLPCLATPAPAPAATSAAVVETLNVRSPSPPVPQVSTRSARRGATAIGVRRASRARRRRSRRRTRPSCGAR